MRTACWLSMVLLASAVLLEQCTAVSATELEGFDEVDDEPVVQQPVATEASAEVRQLFTPSSAVALLVLFRVTARVPAICMHGEDLPVCRLQDLNHWRITNKA